MNGEPRLPLTHFGPGTHVRHYTVIERTGRGSMSEVFRALDTRAGREVALKVLDGVGDRDRREAEAVRTLHHPNIVATVDLFEHEGRLCLVQEWIGGGSLERALRDGRTLDLKETLRVAHDVASALAHAHGVTILHRDIKPSNVMREKSGSYKLVDFGAVGRLEAGTNMTRSGEIAGTPLYMAPEQFTGARQTPATDVFGLGLLLYRCLHGTLPGQEAGNFIELFRARTEQPLIVPVSPLRDLLVRCLEVDPARRASTADEVLWLLERVDLSPPAASASQAGTTKTSRGPMGKAPPDLGPPAPAAPPRRAATVAGGAVIGAGVIAATWWAVAGGAAAAGAVLGLGLAGGGLAVASLIRRRWTSSAPEIERRAAEIVLGAKERDMLTRSLMTEVDRIMARLRGLDARFLGQTITAFLTEYLESPESSDRQTALVHVVGIMEKVQVRLSPWHVRHKDAIASGVAVVGCAAGVAAAVGAFVQS